ncbi:hypothetical protein ACFL2Q_02380 [Thermodesulfobacteriota bacterium]
MKLPEKPFIESSVLEVFSAYSWPGNVRELRNALERAILLTEGGPITPDLLKTTKDNTEEDDGGRTTGKNGKTGQRPRSEGQNEICLIRDVFHALPKEQQGYHLDIMVNRLCGGKAGSVKYVSELLGRTPKTIKNRIKLVTDKDVDTGSPGLDARERMVPKLRKYLIEEILKTAR